MARITLLVASLVLAGALGGTRASAAPAPASCEGLGAEAILVAARASFRAREKPPFVVYTISRRVTVDGQFDIAASYRKRVWYRSSDGAALTRRIERGAALIFERPRFNAALDPGPPTADIFERAAPRQIEQQPPAPGSSLPEIGSVTTHVEADYRPTIVSCDGSTVRLRLVPRREPDRNRLRELWLERATWRVYRFVATDRLYESEVSEVWSPQVDDGTLDQEGGIQVIRTIHAGPPSLGDGGEESDDYRFEAISFPKGLPDWYFEPSIYREHFAEAPSF